MTQAERIVFMWGVLNVFLRTIPLQTASGHMYALKKRKKIDREQQPHRKSWPNHNISGQNPGLQNVNSHGLQN